MQRELTSFPFPSQLRFRFHSKGFTTVEDVLELKPTELSKELNISKEEALETINFLRAETTPQESNPGTSAQKSSYKPDVGQKSSHGSTDTSNNRTVLEMLQDEQSQQSIITFSEKLDNLLNGGVPLTKITEICGAPGTGKTQFSIQLSVDVQIPECFGGIDGEAVYIDTEGSFIVDRVVDIAKATVSHCQHITDVENSPEQLERMETFTLESVLAGIHYFRCQDYVELLALSHVLPEFLQKHPKVSLVVLDSVAFPFRHDFEDYALRTRLLNGLAQCFIRMAVEHKLAVVLTNQMTTKISSDRAQPSYLIPALGESWGHASTIRIILYWQQNHRCALLYKSPSHRETTVSYQITTGGIRDISHPASKPPLMADENDDQPKKRPRLDNT